jgi:hypothetical protein
LQRAFFVLIQGKEKGGACVMATSSITHNFVINDTQSAERFAEALDNPKYEKTNINVEYISSPDNLRLLVKKWKTNIK